MQNIHSFTLTRNAMNKLLFYVVLLAYVGPLFISAVQFEVGGELGWTKPTGKERFTYNEWAAQNRFRIGDTLHFKYVKDSVLLVSSADYLACNTSNPIATFEDSKAVFEFDRSGMFYFISGHSGHCKSGQRLIIRVIHPSAPEFAPAPAPGGDSAGDFGWPGPEANSAAKMSAASFFVTAVAAAPILMFSHFI